MKKSFVLFVLLFTFGRPPVFAHEPDSAYLFSYTNNKTQGRSGLHFAWSKDKINWHAIGPEFAYVKSDYGSWGTEKRMFNPVLFQDAKGLWHSVWNLSAKETPIAHVTSKDLIYWGRQSYFVKENDITIPTPSQKNTERNKRISATILGITEIGSLNKLPWRIIDGLIKKQQLTDYRNRLWAETTTDDASRFASLKPVNVSIKADPTKTKKISNMLMGVFFEDINYAADGGLYAELIQNRGFEYQPSDRTNNQNWNSKTAWSTTGSNVDFTIETVNPVHENNKNYAVLTNRATGEGLANYGFDGIPVKAGEKYNLSFFSKILFGKNGKLTMRLVDKNKVIVASATLNISPSQWEKYNTVLTANETIADARLEIVPQFVGSVALDLVSLFPQKTFKGRKNGLREDLAQTIADLKPRFIRFPGGCVAHGDGIDNIYHWKNTIGPLEARKPQRNLWNYHQTMGLGYFEYFQFCEDIGAEPLPVVAAGVPCQNSEKHGHPLGGQQGGIPIDQMDKYVQDVLDLIEWANGNASTRWGKVRAAAGHPKPFNLKYIGVGNEDLISDVFEERFTIIYNAIKKKYPEITIIGTVGPFFEGTDYTEGWKLANKLKVPMIDEHYYLPPGWFIYNQDFYDKYDRNKSKVYLGEYAAHLFNRSNNLETALAEAIHLTTLERNGDVVEMSSYAPLLAKEGHTQWNPDMVYFNNTQVKPTTGYQVQKLFGNNAGDEYIYTSASYSNNWDKVQNRLAWSFVRDTKTNELILKIVNLLPVNVHPSIDLSAFNPANGEVISTLLKGNPTDKNLHPIVSKTSVNDMKNMSIPPYSLTILRMKLK